jgi:hypothetical protein|tara:strand:- start:43 stop:183 length:141 start_codon:yes stop_codon:yes gene_type:complete
MKTKFVIPPINLSEIDLETSLNPDIPEALNCDFAYSIRVSEVPSLA